MPQTESEPTAEARRKGRRDDPGSLELYTTAFVCGAAVMTIEVVGTRIVGPVFGVGLYVWAALLAVTLASLSTGYYLGGQLADPRPDASLLARVVLLAGALLALTPLAHRPVLGLGESLGIRLLHRPIARRARGDFQPTARAVGP